jgi:hypothetical protein
MPWLAVPFQDDTLRSVLSRKLQVLCVGWRRCRAAPSVGVWGVEPTVLEGFELCICVVLGCKREE